MFRPMPTIKTENLSGAAQTFAKAIISNQGKNKGRLRAAKVSSWDNETYYVWRMVSLVASPDPKASCMPVSAIYTSFFYSENPQHLAPCKLQYNFQDEGCTCDIIGRKAIYREKENARRKELDNITDEIIATIPLSEWYGARRWSKAFTGNDFFDKGGILDNVSANLTQKEELEGASM